MALVLIKGAETADEKRRARAAEEQLNALVAQMRQIMAKYDTNSDGALSLEEATTMLQFAGGEEVVNQAGGGDVMRHYVKAQFAKFDVNHDVSNPPLPARNLGCP